MSVNDIEEARRIVDAAKEYLGGGAKVLPSYMENALHALEVLEKNGLKKDDDEYIQAKMVTDLAGIGNLRYMRIEFAERIVGDFKRVIANIKNDMKTALDPRVSKIVKIALQYLAEQGHTPKDAEDMNKAFEWIETLQVIVAKSTHTINLFRDCAQAWLAGGSPRDNVPPANVIEAVDDALLVLERAHLVHTNDFTVRSLLDSVKRAIKGESPKFIENILPHTVALTPEDEEDPNDSIPENPPNLDEVMVEILDHAKNWSRICFEKTGHVDHACDVGSCLDPKTGQRLKNRFGLIHCVPETLENGTDVVSFTKSIQEILKATEGFMWVVYGEAYLTEGEEAARHVGPLSEVICITYQKLGDKTYTMSAPIKEVDGKRVLGEFCAPIEARGGSFCDLFRMKEQTKH